MESVLELSCALADAGDNDIRIEAALAKLWASEMAWQIADELVQIRGGRGYETAESLAARGERAVPGRAAAARPADQPDLRGLDARSCTCSSPARRSTRTSRRPATCLAGRRPAGQGAGGGRGQRLLREVAAAARRPARARCRRRTASSARWPVTCASSSGRRAGWPARRSTGCRAGRRRWSTTSASSAGSSTSGRSCSRWRRRASRAEMLLADDPERGAVGAAAGRRLLRAGAPAGRGALRRAVEQHRRRPTASWPRRCSPATSPGSRRACSTRARAPGPGSPAWEPGPSTQESVWRDVR